MKKTSRRSPAPQWGNRPPGFKGGDIFKLKDVQDLARIAHKTDPASVSDLCLLLDGETHSLRIIAHVHETDVSDADQRAALKILAPLARQLLKYLESADLSTRQSILNAYLGNDHLSAFTTDIEHLRRMKEAIDEALEPGHRQRVKKGIEKASPPSGGRPRDVDIPEACQLLGMVYEEFTGLPFTYDYSPAEKRFRTRSARFVARAMKAVFPAITDASLATPMRQLKKKLEEARIRKADEPLAESPLSKGGVSAGKSL